MSAHVSSYFTAILALMSGGSLMSDYERKASGASFLFLLRKSFEFEFLINLLYGKACM